MRRRHKGDGSSGAKHWYLGPKNRAAGSIHSDFRTQSAVDLCDANYLAVYPIGGWWKDRKHLKCYDKKVRYSLVVSIETPGVAADLYTPIITQIGVATPVEIEI